MIPIKKVEQLINKHQSLEKELSSGNIDKKGFATKSKEYSSLGEIIQCAREYLNFENQKKDLDKMINERNTDKEIKELAQKELKDLIEDHFSYVRIKGEISEIRVATKGQLYITLKDETSISHFKKLKKKKTRY